MPRTALALLAVALVAGAAATVVLVSTSGSTSERAVDSAPALSPTPAATSTAATTARLTVTATGMQRTALPGADLTYNITVAN